MALLLVTNDTQDAHYGGVYLLDTTGRQLRRVFTEPSRGITTGPDGLYVVGTGGVIGRLRPETWECTLSRETGLTGVHDLRWLNGEFVLVASRGNWTFDSTRTSQ